MHKHNINMISLRSSGMIVYFRVLLEAVCHFSLDACVPKGFLLLEFCEFRMLRVQRDS